MKLYCPKCREVNDWGRTVCTSCGASLRGPEGETYVDKLIWALYHPEAANALRAATILGELKAAEAVEGLQGVLGKADADPYVKSAAVRALGDIGDERARRTVIEALEHAPISVRLAAVEALEALGPNEEAARALQRVCEDRSLNLRESAGETLSRWSGATELADSGSEM